MSDPIPARADYGMDAPGVVRNLLIGSALGLLIWGSAALGFWSGTIAIPLGGSGIRIALTGLGRGCGLGFGFMAIWMIWSSKLGKVHERVALLDRIAWKGNETVLDLGCGRGLMLVGAAKRLTTGKAIGVDIWQAEDLSGNRPEATLENARREGVGDRVEIKTADMRALPFPDATFDVIVSRAAIHNIYVAAERAKAIAEVARVLKPGGQILIDDIRHIPEYAATLRQHGCADIRFVGSRWIKAFLMVLTMGSLRPGILLARKAV